MESYAKILNFETISAKPDKALVLARLGFRKSLTEIDGLTAEKLEQGFKDGSLYCRSRGAAGRFSIVEHRDSLVRIETGLVIESKKLAEFLKSSDELLLLATTVGREIMDRIEQEIQNGNAAYGIILDAVASETADAGLDWMMDFFNKILRREGKKLTRHRYSPGYGDIDLSYQKAIFDILDLGKLELSLTEKFMLIPEKSVIAIAGVERNGIHE